MINESVISNLNLFVAVENSSADTSKKIKLKLWLYSWLTDYETTDISEDVLLLYGHYMEDIIYPCFENVYLSDLSPVILQKFYNDILINGQVCFDEINTKIKTLFGIHNMLEKSLNQAVTFRLIDINPCNKVYPIMVHNKFYKIIKQPQNTLTG